MVVGKEVQMERKCYNHPEIGADKNCQYCGRYLCSACLNYNEKGGYYTCVNQDDCMKYQAEASTNQRKEDNPQKPINASFLAELAWKYHQHGEREKLLNTLILLMNSYPESEEARITFKSFYTSNYFKKKERKTLQPFIDKYKHEEKKALSVEINESVKKVILGTLPWGVANGILWFIWGADETQKILTLFPKITFWMHITLYFGLIFGIILVCIGVLGLIIRHPIVVLLSALAFFTVGAWNISGGVFFIHEFSIVFLIQRALSGEDWLWKILGILQIIWGFQALRTYFRATSFRIG